MELETGWNPLLNDIWATEPCSSRRGTFILATEFPSVLLLFTHLLNLNSSASSSSSLSLWKGRPSLFSSALLSLALCPALGRDTWSSLTSWFEGGDGGQGSFRHPPASQELVASENLNRGSSGVARGGVPGLERGGERNPSDLLLVPGSRRLWLEPSLWGVC